MNVAELLIPDLREQVAVVTGAGRGIGRTIARALAACGATTVVTARSLPELEGLAREIERDGGRALPVPADLSDRAALRSIFETVDRELDGRLDVLVNNAGLGLYGDIAEFPLDDLDRLIDVNVTAVFAGCQEALRRMIPARRGAIVNIASVVGLKGYPHQAGYTATKHAVVGLTKTLAIEAREHGIRASVVCPGGVDTDMIAAARPDLDRSILLRTEDVAKTVLFLLSLPPRAAVDSIYIRRFGSEPL